jgi:hypothetical protein
MEKRDKVGVNGIWLIIPGWVIVLTSRKYGVATVWYVNHLPRYLSLPTFLGESQWGIAGVCVCE